MNPIFARMVNSHQQQKINKAKNKQEEVFSAISNMSPEQRTKFQSYFPMIKSLATKLGVPEEQINNSFSQLQSRM